MIEYLNRETVLKELDRNSITKKITFSDGVSIYDSIQKLPTADVVEVKHGTWIKPTKFSVPICCECRRTPNMMFGLLPDYCPHCGTKMDGERKEQ